MLRFTGQAGIYGRLDLAQGEIEVFDAPASRPAEVWGAESGADKLIVVRTR